MDDKGKGLFRKLFGAKRYEPRPGPLAELDRPLLEKPGEMVPTDFLEPGYAFKYYMNKLGLEKGGESFDRYSERYPEQEDSFNNHLISQGQSLDGAGFRGRRKGLPLQNGNIDFEAIAQFLMQQDQSDQMIDTANKTMIPGVDVFGTRKKVR